MTQTLTQIRVISRDGKERVYVIPDEKGSNRGKRIGLGGRRVSIINCLQCVERTHAFSDPRRNIMMLIDENSIITGLQNNPKRQSSWSARYLSGDTGISAADNFIEGHVGGGSGITLQVEPLEQKRKFRNLKIMISRVPANP